MNKPEIKIVRHYLGLVNWVVIRTRDRESGIKIVYDQRLLYSSVKIVGISRFKWRRAIRRLLRPTGQPFDKALQSLWAEYGGYMVRKSVSLDGSYSRSNTEPYSLYGTLSVMWFRSCSRGTEHWPWEPDGICVMRIEPRVYDHAILKFLKFN